MGALRRFALLVAVVAAGCGTDDGTGMGPDQEPPPGSGATLEFMLKNGGDLGALPTQVGDVTVESVAFWIDRIELMGDRDGYGQGGGALDLTKGPAPFDLKDASPQLYSRLRVDFSEADGDSGALHGLSYRVAGKTAGGAPFVLSGRDEFRLDLRAVDGAELGARTKLLCVVRLDMSGWFAGVALAAGPRSSASGDGTYHHSEGGDGSNPFLNNVERSASMTLSAVPR